MSDQNMSLEEALEDCRQAAEDRDIDTLIGE